MTVGYMFVKASGALVVELIFLVLTVDLVVGCQYSLSQMVDCKVAVHPVQQWAFVLFKE